MADDQHPAARLMFGEFAIDRTDERLIGPAGPVRLGRKAFRLLVQLAELEGRLLTKDELFSTVWDGTTVSEAALTSVVKELRRALNDDSRAPSYIETVYGRGYRLLQPVAQGEEAPAPSPADAFPTLPTPAQPRRLGAPPILRVSSFTGQGAVGGDPDLAAQLREEILSGLARFRELQLIAEDRSAADDPARRDIGGYELTAMIVPQADGGKIIARLQRLVDGVIVWTESIALPAASMATALEGIVRRIVGAALPVVDEDMFLELPSEADSVHKLYLSAKWASNHARSHAEALEAVRTLEAIIAEHPRFALAYPPLVRLYNTDYGYTGLGATGEPERARALALAKSGLALDRVNAHAHSVLGFCHLWRGDLGLARSCFDRSLSLNPYSHVRVQEAATAFTYMGDGTAARDLMRRAAELNPIADDSYHEDMGRLLLIEGDCEGALQNLRALADGSIWAELYAALCELKLGLAQGRERVAAWRDAVGARWNSGRPPATGELVDWVRRHHPFPSPIDKAFAGGIAAALEPETSAASASR